MTNFLEYDGGCVRCVAADMPPEEALIMVLTVPLLVRVLSWRVGLRRGEVDPDTEPIFSLMTEVRRRK